MKKRNKSRQKSGSGSAGEENKKRKREQMPPFLLAVFALAFVFAVFVLPKLAQKGNSVAPTVPVQVSDPIGRHPLTGMSIYENVDLPQVFGVMIDNHVDAWPQAGVDKAFLVFEAPVEAGISRMLAFFSQEQTVEKIGPVRSARPYFLDWNSELDGLYVHVGGSDEALDKIVSGGTADLNQYWFDEFFWRANNRYAPHNVYTSTQLLSQASKKKQEQGTLSDSLYESWTFKDPAVSPEPEVERVAVSFYPPDYVAVWKYDRPTNRYVRFQGDTAHIMEDGAQVIADNIAVVITDVTILDNVGRRKMKTIGEGDAFVFQDGKRIIGTWKKASQSQRLRFYDEDESEIVFNSGVTWIEVIPDEDALDYEV